MVYIILQRTPKWNLFGCRMETWVTSKFSCKCGTPKPGSERTSSFSHLETLLAYSESLHVWLPMCDLCKCAHAVRALPLSVLQLTSCSQGRSSQLSAHCRHAGVKIIGYPPEPRVFCVAKYTQYTTRYLHSLVFFGRARSYFYCSEHLKVPISLQDANRSAKGVRTVSVCLKVIVESSRGYNSHFKKRHLPIDSKDRGSSWVWEEHSMVLCPGRCSVAYDIYVDAVYCDG